MAKRKADKAKDAAERGAIIVPIAEGGVFEDAFAQTTLRPTVQAARTLFQSQGDQHTVKALTNELAAIVRASIDGNTERSESMLLSQAHVLDELFHVLTRRALLNFKETYMDAGERYMRLALKAQSQARTTLETLAAIKNPPIFATQANIAHGPQQINNGLNTESSARERPHARENEIRPNELLENTANERLDDDTTGKAISGDIAMEALAEVHGPGNDQWQGSRVA